MQSPHGPLRTYGRIKSRPIKPRQEALLESLLPRIAVPEGPIDPAALMPEARAAWLEIGFGGGEHMAGQAALHPEVLILGAEPFLNGVASALRHIDEQALTNVRLLQGDARDLVSRLSAACLERVFILFPDPWPKARHHKRRIIQTEFLGDLMRVMKPGGILRYGTDWADYADWTLERLTASPDFQRRLYSQDDPTGPPEGHLTTRYETKKLGDCAPVFFEFVRV
ncbi:MAG: tRNA (guanosine(46)-N7)-methyltransferase TrmB [Alphaproteobacteria bacterium]